MKLFVTGGAGFIGSNFIHYWLSHYPNDTIVNYDVLTYAGNLDNLKAIENDPRHQFVKGDILDRDEVKKAVHGCDLIVHFAAESHVDRSIHDPSAFMRTNVLGTQALLDIARELGIRFHHISTDEVFGTLESHEEPWTEHSPYRPRSPYAVSKASSDHLVRAYHKTYGMHITISNCSNNYGPYHFPEKIIPLFITNLLEGKKVPVYGDGLQVRDWIHVEDHCRGIDAIIQKGRSGETYLLGGGNQTTNLDLTKKILQLLARDESYIEYVKDRPGHDRRYDLSIEKARVELGWLPRYTLETGLAQTVEWYHAHEDWWKKLKNESFTEYYQKQYGVSDIVAKEDAVAPRIVAPVLHTQKIGMKAVITAGGRGTRLRPITWTMNKHLVPLANEPMLFNALRKVSATGIKEVAIIVNPGDTEIMNACGNGERWGIALTYIEQIGGALGLANTLWQAREFVGDDNVLLYLGDNIILGTLNGMIEKFHTEQLDCCLAFMEVDDARRFGSPIFDASGKMIGAVEKPEHPEHNLAIAGLYIVKGPVYFEAYQHINISARGEYEIPDTFDWMIKNGKQVGYHIMTGWWKDTGKPEDLLEGNQLLLNEITIEETQIASTAYIAPGARIQGRVKIGAGAKIGRNVLIRGPVVIGEDVVLENCYIGPHTTIGNKTIVRHAEIEHSIVMDEARIETPKRISESIIGYKVCILADDNKLPRGHKLIVGENSYLEL